MIGGVALLKPDTPADNPMKRAAERLRLAVKVNANVVDAQKRAADQFHRSANAMIGALTTDALNAVKGAKKS